MVSIVQTLMETRRRMRELAELARFDCPVQVLRDSVVRNISSSQLVPGDVVLVGTGLLPCDLALIDGGAVVNESMLTGQSTLLGACAVLQTSPVFCTADSHVGGLLMCLIGIISDAQVSPFLS